MLEFNVQGMSCGHCVGRVTAAIRQVDSSAGVAVDLTKGHITVTTERERAPFVAALADAGYPPS